ncbi:MvdC/MvdD family ATP grasp protein [Geminocystis sp. CENA526]|uniref:MvdC/MvdD family ATP grasp protein n=1 Tax=Geminocystis sp. CENA526 TaxID=1355871 RepID=UPI003D6FD0B6
MILIFTEKKDTHVNKVGEYFNKANISWFRINTEDFCDNISLTIEPTKNKSLLKIKDSNLVFPLESIKAVWYRKPAPVDVSHFNLDQANLDYIQGEFNQVIDGIYALLHERLWINNPLTSRLAHRKPLQLKIANELGFITPKTLITNEPEKALEFAESINWDLAIKSLGAICVNSSSDEENAELNYGLFTRRVNKEELLTLQNNIAYMPTVFQEYIEKDYELRITVVGEQIFACRIESQKESLSSEDMRFNISNLSHKICDLPSEINEKLLAYLKTYNLNFGCFDLAVNKNGEYIFFECNPNGQWLWIEKLTDAPISKAVANLLINNI